MEIGDGFAGGIGAGEAAQGEGGVAEDWGDAELFEAGHGVRPDTDAGAGFAEFGGLLEEGGGEADFAEGDSGGEAADARAEDEDAEGHEVFHLWRKVKRGGRMGRRGFLPPGILAYRDPL